MSKREINIEYFNKETPVELPPTYDEFIKLIVSKFFITEKMKKNMSIIYYDEDDDIITLDKDNYSDSIEEAKKLVLQIPEIKTNKPGGNFDVEKLQKDVIKKMESVQNDIEIYKKKLTESCKKAVEKKLEEVDAKHEEEIKKLVEFYENKLNDIKSRIAEKSKKIVDNLQNKSSSLMNEQLEEYKKYIETEMGKLMKEKTQLLEKKLGEVDFTDLEKKQKEVSDTVDKNKQLLDNIGNNKK